MHYEALDALVDTRASYLVVPRSILSALGVAVAERRHFATADEREAEMDVGVASLCSPSSGTTGRELCWER